MNTAAVKHDTRDIVVEKVFAHPPEKLWEALTTSALMSRWLRMPMTG